VLGANLNDTAEAEADAAARSEAARNPRRPTVELFNLKRDPAEQKNLAGEQPEKVKELRARYEALAREAVPPKAGPKPPDFLSPKAWGE